MKVSTAWGVAAALGMLMASSDQLKEHVIEPGENLSLKSIPCNSWDVKLVDEDGDACVVEAVDICGASGTWVITSRDLLKCQSHS